MPEIVLAGPVGRHQKEIAGGGQLPPARQIACANCHYSFGQIAYAGRTKMARSKTREAISAILHPIRHNDLEARRRRLRLSRVGSATKKSRVARAPLDGLKSWET
jgi:hypothetical protein